MTRRIWFSFAILLAGAGVLAALDAREQWSSGFVLLAGGAVILAAIVAAGDDMDQFMNRVVRRR
jgi:hypothetical protein